MILLTFPGGLLRWSPLPPDTSEDPEQDERDERDMRAAQREAFEIDGQRAREYSTQHWGRRFRHLGLLPAVSALRIPWLGGLDSCPCNLCRPAPLPRGSLIDHQAIITDSDTSEPHDPVQVLRQESLRPSDAGPATGYQHHEHCRAYHHDGARSTPASCSAQPV